MVTYPILACAWCTCMFYFMFDISNVVKGGSYVRIKPQTKIKIKCKYNQYQEIIDHTTKNMRHQDLTWFTQSLVYIHQIASPILL